MAKRKIYAAWFSGKENEAVFFDDWESCQAYVAGLSNIRYRGFPDLDHAKEFLGHPFHEEEQTLFHENQGDNLLIYVDGSYLEGHPYAGWAWASLKPVSNSPTGEKEVLVAEGKGTSPEPAVSRNIDGELLAVVEAMKWAAEYIKSQQSDWTKTHVVIFHDYIGTEKWVHGKWKAKQALTQQYQQDMAPYRHLIEFRKVSAHSGKKWNEYVDRLAKQAVLDRGKN